MSGGRGGAHSLKNCCSFSLAKLIRNCSRLLRAKLSKPKMSSRPMVRLASQTEEEGAAIMPLMRDRTQPKSAPAQGQG